MQYPQSVHVNTPERGTFEVPWSEATRLANTQELGPNTSFWFEGQANWLKAQEFLALSGGVRPFEGGYAPPIQAAWSDRPAYGAAPMASQGPRSGVKPLATFAIAVSILVGVSEMFDFFVATLELQQLGLIDDAVQNPESASMAQLTALDGQVSSASMLSLVAYIIAGIVWCIWKHSAAKNVRAMGAEGLETSPGLAAGGYFIPFANLYIPFKAMSEIIRASANPGNWKAEKLPPIVSVWWAMWILGNMLSWAVVRMTMSASTPESVKSALNISLASTGMTAIAAALAIAVCWKVTKLQEPYAAQM